MTGLLVVACGVALALAAYLGWRLRAAGRTTAAHVLEVEARAEALEAKAQLHIEAGERARRELQDFLYVASHDLRAPLRTIIGFAELMQRSDSSTLSDDDRENLDLIVDGGQRLRELLDGLLSMSRVSTRGAAFELVDLGQSVEAVVEELDESIQAAEATIHTSRLPTVEADRGQILQLLKNMIANSIKFRRPEVACEVRISAPSLADGPDPGNDVGVGRDRCSIVIEDNGIGFKEVDRERIFDLFERLHGQDDYSGAGIGLTICQRIVQRHGGTIAADGRPGEGARFEVTLPVRRERSSESSP